MLRAAGVRVSIRPSSVSVDPPSVSRRLGRRARRLLLGRAVHRRGDARPRVADHDPRRQPQPAPHRPARRARADGRPRQRPSTGGGSAASRSATSRCARRELTATTIRAREVPLLVDELPLFALLAAHARGELGLRRGGAARTRRPTGSRRSSTRCARSACARRRTTTASRSPASRRDRRAAGSTRAATTGSRCSAPSQGSSRAKASRSRARRAWRYPSPASSTFDWTQRSHTDDRRHRRTGRRRQEHGRARSRSGSASATSTPGRCTAP